MSRCTDTLGALAVLERLEADPLWTRGAGGARDPNILAALTRGLLRR